MARGFAELGDHPVFQMPVLEDRKRECGDPHNPILFTAVQEGEPTVIHSNVAESQKTQR